MANNQGLSAQIVERTIVEPNVNVKYPEITGLPNKSVQDKINESIRKLMKQLMLQQGYNRDDLAEMIGTYTIGLNEQGILSIKFENFSIFEMAAHGLNVVRSMTVNLHTGKQYEIYELFRPGSPYKLIISSRIKQEIRRQDLPLLREFRRINDDQAYYLTPDNLVVYWQRYEYTPGFVGEPEFNIPYTILANVIDEEGPLVQ
ncbi:MAG: DUF3298 domain-containing protein [Bacillota bacterium]